MKLMKKYIIQFNLFTIIISEMFLFHLAMPHFLHPIFNFHFHFHFHNSISSPAPLYLEPRIRLVSRLFHPLLLVIVIFIIITTIYTYSSPSIQATTATLFDIFINIQIPFYLFIFVLPYFPAASRVFPKNHFTFYHFHIHLFIFTTFPCIPSTSLSLTTVLALHSSNEHILQSPCSVHEHLRADCNNFASHCRTSASVVLVYMLQPLPPSHIERVEWLAVVCIILFRAATELFNQQNFIINNNNKNDMVGK